MNLNNWMAAVDGSETLARLSIPGTHDSCALYDHATAGYTQTQSLSIKDQLLNGIRFLDIRPTYDVDGKPFEITHGGYDQNISFAEVQQEVIDFLNANPSETVLMNIQQEYSTASNADFVIRLDSIIHGHENFWFFGPHIPSLHEARKRIVLIRSFDPATYDPNGGGGWADYKGISWNGFDINGKSSNGNFLTQNYWNAWESDKLAEIKEMFDLPVIGNQFILNFLSYAHGGATPGRNAKAMNLAVMEYIKQLSRPRCLGIVPMDFTGNTSGFNEQIIGFNPFT